MQLSLSLRRTAAAPADRDDRGRFRPGNRYRMVTESRSIGGSGYTRRVNGVSRKTVQFCRACAQGNTR